jgi:hypothetical protein
MQCSSGKYSADVGATSLNTCTECTAGQFSTTGSSFCSNYIVGKYATTNASACTICAPGFAKETSGTCDLCEKGTYKTHAGNEACKHCGAGKYYDLEAMLDCSVDNCIGQNVCIVEQDSNTRRSGVAPSAVRDDFLASMFIRTAEI